MCLQLLAIGQLHLPAEVRGLRGRTRHQGLVGRGAVAIHLGEQYGALAAGLDVADRALACVGEPSFESRVAESVAQIIVGQRGNPGWRLADPAHSPTRPRCEPSRLWLASDGTVQA